MHTSDHCVSRWDGTRLYQNSRPLRVLLYRLDASFVVFDPRNKPLDVRRILSQMVHLSRTDVLPVSPATLGDSQAAVEYLLAFDQFSTKPLELLTVCEGDQVIGFAIHVNVDKERLFLLDPI